MMIGGLKFEQVHILKTIISLIIFMDIRIKF